jgi:hypothetical protein
MEFWARVAVDFDMRSSLTAQGALSVYPCPHGLNMKHAIRFRGSGTPNPLGQPFPGAPRASLNRGHSFLIAREAPHQNFIRSSWTKNVRLLRLQHIVMPDLALLQGKGHLSGELVSSLPAVNSAHGGLRRWLRRHHTLPGFRTEYFP